MDHARSRAGARPWRSLLCGAVSLTALLLCLTAGPAAADCTTGGSSCLPGTGYSTDVTWNCGAIDDTYDCYYNSTTNPALADIRSWGWGSAAYNGSGSSYVCVYGGGSFYACGTNIARACFYANCNAQSLLSFRLWVKNITGTHTVWGHGMS
ncbi:hypothetical protein [Conexibacter arvalis]|uniref:Uncharacterized protein n=1 Tax=Conexibacter arvalis TaxID=912552 RepID=A0A840IF80_9ACTN|nr:hypothetical protein [Conexibacter arvalis]MBB4662975.1 hypothetical protein [Conexibacter arvalis]